MGRCVWWLVALGFWAALLSGCAGLDPRAPGFYRLELVGADGSAARLEVDAPAPFFVEPVYELVVEGGVGIERTAAGEMVFHDLSTSGPVRMVARIGADAGEARGFWGEAWAGVCGFVMGLFAV